MIQKSLVLLTAMSLLPVYAQSGTGSQLNTPAASLFVQGQTGNISLDQGTWVTGQIMGAPGALFALAVGQPRNPGSGTGGAGFLHLQSADIWLADGYALGLTTDANGSWAGTWQLPWFWTPGMTVAVQGLVEDSGSSLGATLTGPTTLTVSATPLVPQQLYFDPTLGAKGVEHFLPPAGTLPGDLPTLSSSGFPGATDVFSGGKPVHTVFQNPFYCYACHGSAQSIWPTYMGTMMANSARDPLFRGQFAIAVAGLDWLQQTGESPVGGEVAADFCIRCHSPNGWMGGRSGFEGDGVTEAFEPALFDHDKSLDLEGVVCDSCHRTAGFEPAISPTGIAVAGQPENAQLVFSPHMAKRGPYPGTRFINHAGGTTNYGALVPPAQTTVAPVVPHNPPLQEGTAVSPGHPTVYADNLKQSEFCGSCHNITNPVNGLAIERTYTEWLNSDFGDPQNPSFKTCQECHMPAQANEQGCTLAGSDPNYGAWDKVRSELRKHEFVGGNAWVPQLLKNLYPNVDQGWTSGQNFMGLVHPGSPSRDALYDATSANAIQKLRESAEVDLVAQEVVPGTISASVTVTNLTGHKLPTGYSEGRRMWVRVEARDAQGNLIFESGALDSNSELISDPQLKVYEAKQGLDYPSLGLSGPSFHFVLNNAIFKDNRILPKGGRQVKGFGGSDSYDPQLAPWPIGGLYPDGQHWDTTGYQIPVPPGTPRPISVRATVLYQTSSFAYIDFLANGGDNVMTTAPHPDAVAVRNMWLNGLPAPAIPVGVVGMASTADPAGNGQTALAVIP